MDNPPTFPPIDQLPAQIQSQKSLRLFASALTLIVFCCGTPTLAAPAITFERMANDLIVASEVYSEAAIQAACDHFVAHSTSAIQPLSKLITHENSVVRWKAIETIERIDLSANRPPNGLLKKLSAAAEDMDADVRSATATCLAHCFPNAVKTREITERLANDPHPVVRANALYSQWTLLKEPQAVIGLTKLLIHDNWMSSEQAETHLLSIGLPAEAPVTSLTIEITTGPNRGSTLQQVRCLRTLAHLCGSEAAQHQFRCCLSHSSHAVVREAAKGVARHDPRAVRLLAGLLMSSDPINQATALETLATLGTRAQQAVPQVQSLFSDDTPKQLQIVAITILPKLTVTSRQLLRHYAQLLEHEEADVRAAALLAIRSWGATAYQLLPQVLVIAKLDSEDFVRQSANATIKHLDTND